VPALPASELLDAPPGEATANVRERCAPPASARWQRQGKPNQALQGQEIDPRRAGPAAAASSCNTAAARLGWSARATHRALKVARTIADLAGATRHAGRPCGRGGAVPACPALGVTAGIRHLLIA
jgi:magnesium chelatase family protein